MEEIISPEKILHLSLNIKGTIFENVFSKMEFLGAYEYIMEQFQNLMIPTLSVSITPNNFYSSRYRDEKDQRRLKNVAPRGPQHDEFMGKFYSLVKKFPPISSFERNCIDIMTDIDISNAIRQSGKKVIVLSGFTTDSEIMINSSLLHYNGFIPVVISDATSTFSERMFFTALEFISLSGEVIDSRDLMKIWGY